MSDGIRSANIGNDSGCPFGWLRIPETSKFVSKYYQNITLDFYENRLRETRDVYVHWQF
jgi:hypothetical protein